MEKKMMRIMGIIVLMLVIISLMVLGCRREQAPPPAQTPPPAGTVQTPAPTGTAPVTQDPNQLQVGMASAQVQQIMGAPAQTEQKGAIIEWKYYTPQGKVEVKLQNDRVIAVERH